MWQWARRWVDWVRHDLLPLAQARRAGCQIHIAYESGGRTRADLPVPWLADAVVVEVVLRVPPAARRKTDFVLRFPDRMVIPAEYARAETNHRTRVGFRMPVPRFTLAGDFLWKQHTITSVTVPVLTAETFLGGLTLSTPTVAVRLAEQTVAARSFVTTGCRGLVASAVLRSPHRLGPAADLGLSVEFRNETTGHLLVVPVLLPGEQRDATEAVLVARCPRVPRRPGWWSVYWRVGSHVLAYSRVEASAPRRFEDAVHVAEVRFAVTGKDGLVRIIRQTPPPGTTERLGPCFLLAGSEPGAVGLCRLTILTTAPGNALATTLVDQDVLVTDVPTAFTPGLLGAEELARVGGFELRLNGRLLSTASLSPAPPATITAEGGFKPPPDFPWTAAAEDELIDRLGKLGGS